MLWILRSFSLLILIFVLIPSLPWKYWWIRIFDYPRVQKIILTFICWLIWIWVWIELSETESLIWLFLLAITLIYLGRQILAFTRFGQKMVQEADYDEERGIHIVVSNVYQYNDAYSPALDMALDQSPDILFFVETDEGWKNALSPLEEFYPYKILVPKDNTYGLLFYSKLEIERQEIKHLIDDEIPSLEVDLILKGGDRITVYALHPTPPVPGESETSTDRDAEILLVGQKAKANPLPSLVIGDLNDVAWSSTTELFLKISGLSDPRRGRGFFNTFHAKKPLLRWPLDHIFMSSSFGISSLEILPAINSDHFPIGAKVVLCEATKVKTMDADSEDRKLAKEQIQDAKE